MPNNFKSDDSFLTKLAIGAAGTNATITKLWELGFNPIELERGSTGYKIWKKIKIKRVRVPDILCLNTGLRVESRGKTKLEISMSHSLKDPRRAWDAGMRDDDYVSIVLFDNEDDSPISIARISPIHFTKVADLRRTFRAEHVSITTPKGVEEGSEIRVIWPCAVAKSVSRVSEITDTRIALSPVAGGKNQYIRLSRSNGRIQLIPQVLVDENVETNQIIASVVPVKTAVTLPPNVNEEYFVAKLNSLNLSERYAAAKALRFRGYSEKASNILRTHVNNPEEDIYVQLEAAAALASAEDDTGWEFLKSKLQGDLLEVPLETQLETLIVASEIPSNNSEQMLIAVLRDVGKHEELRAGAAWALGQFASPNSANALVDTFNSTSLEVKIEAARALLKIAEPQIEYMVDLLKEVDSTKRDGIAWALARSGGFQASPLVPTDDSNLRIWLSYILGNGKARFSEEDLQAICKTDPEVYFAASVLWQVVESWIANLREY